MKFFKMECDVEKDCLHINALIWKQPLKVTERGYIEIPSGNGEHIWYGIEFTAEDLEALKNYEAEK